jgi:hypothetical protein
MPLTRRQALKAGLAAAGTAATVGLTDLAFAPAAAAAASNVSPAGYVTRLGRYSRPRSCGCRPDRSGHPAGSRRSLIASSTA